MQTLLIISEGNINKPNFPCPSGTSLKGNILGVLVDSPEGRAKLSESLHCSNSFLRHLGFMLFLTMVGLELHTLGSLPSPRQMFALNYEAVFIDASSMIEYMEMASSLTTLILFCLEHFPRLDVCMFRNSVFLCTTYSKYLQRSFEML